MATFDANRVEQTIVPDILLIWADFNIDAFNEDSKQILIQLRRIVNDTIVVTRVDDCVEFLKQVALKDVVVITSDTFGKTLVPHIHSIVSVNTIYIFCPDQVKWIDKWSKVKGVQFIYEALELVVRRYEENSIPISFVQAREQWNSAIDCNCLDPSFMYTRIFKTIILDMKHDDESREIFIDHCQQRFASNARELTIIGEFKRTYRPEKAIWWYTRECFIYHMLNRALRHLECDTIVNMGFFIHDLHRQLQRLNKQQKRQFDRNLITVFRGQALSTTDFSRLRNLQGGLLAFNNFLSTSKKRSTCLKFARAAISKPDVVGIFFVMTIDPKLASIPLAHIDKQSYFQNEDEILFSMHTVFRIEQVNSLEQDNRIFEVHSTMTNDDDPQLQILSTLIEQEVEGEGWARLGFLLNRLGHWDKAEGLYLALLGRATNEYDKGIYQHQLGLIKDQQGSCSEAIQYYQASLDIFRRILPANDSSLANTYNNIGAVYDKMGEYAKALCHYQNALDIFHRIHPANHSDLAITFNNIGGVYYNREEYLEALSYYEKALTIFEKTLPTNHPDLATLYNNIALLHKNMAEHSKALLHYQKTLDILQKTLPDNHSHLATAYGNIGVAYDSMGDYSLALSFHSRALNVREKVLPADHPDFSISYQNIGGTFYEMSEYSKALSSFERAQNIAHNTLPPNHPNLKNIRRWIEIVTKRL